MGQYDSVSMALRPCDIVFMNCEPGARGQVVPNRYITWPWHAGIDDVCASSVVICSGNRGIHWCGIRKVVSRIRQQEAAIEIQEFAGLRRYKAFSAAWQPGAGIFKTSVAFLPDFGSRQPFRASACEEFGSITSRVTFTSSRIVIAQMY